MSRSQNEPTKIADLLGGPPVIALGRMILELVAVSTECWWLLYAHEKVAVKVGFGMGCWVNAQGFQPVRSRHGSN